MLDLLFRGASIVDGSGRPAFRADVGVSQGCIAEIGAVKTGSRQTVDCGGLTLMPGIVDVHTHYDAQVTWDPTLSPSVSLGVRHTLQSSSPIGSSW